MEFTLLLILLVISFLLIVISLAEKSIVFGVVGGVILFIIGASIFLDGFSYPNGSTTAISDYLNGTITAKNTVTAATIKDNYTSFISGFLMILSIFITLFLYEDFQKRGLR